MLKYYLQSTMRKSVEPLPRFKCNGASMNYHESFGSFSGATDSIDLLEILSPTFLHYEKKHTLFFNPPARINLFVYPTYIYRCDSHHSQVMMMAGGSLIVLEAATRTRGVFSGAEKQTRRHSLILQFRITVYGRQHGRWPRCY